MATNLALNDKLLEEAKKISNIKTKKEVVETALEEFIQKRKRLGIIKLFGTVDFDGKYDYKEERRRRQKKLEKIWKNADSN